MANIEDAIRKSNLLKNFLLRRFSLYTIRNINRLVANSFNSIMVLIFYFLVLSPIALLMRFFGRNFLVMNKNNKKTYWINKNKSTNYEEEY